MANYASTTKTWSLSDTYSNGAACGVTLTVTVDASGNGSYKLYTDKSANGSSQTAFSIVLRVFSASTTMANGDYTTGTALVSGYYQNWGKWPNKVGTSTTGTFSLPGGASAASFKVDFAICAAQAATLTSNSSRLDNGAAARLGSSGNWGATFTRTPATYTVTFNANGGNTPSPTSKTVTSGSTYGTLASCTRNTANNYAYSLKGWYTATSGGTKITSSSTVNISANQTLYAQWNSTLLTSACGTPTVTIYTYPESYYFQVRAKAGSNGTGNDVTGVELFITIDGTEPSTTNYQYHSIVNCSSGSYGSKYVYTDNWTDTCISWYGRDMTIKAKARTLGAAGSSFYSGLSSTVSASYYHYGKSTNGVTITNPSASGLVCGCSDSEYINITWEDEDLNVAEYYVSIYEASTGSWVDAYWTYDTYCSICTNWLSPGSSYYVMVDKYDNLDYNWINSTPSRGLITVNTVTPFSEPSVQVLPAGSFPAVKPDWRQDNSRLLYLNNGNGNICKLSWPYAYATGNKRRGSEVYIDVRDARGDSTAYTVLAEFVGDVNEYYVKADLIEKAIEGFNQLGLGTPEIFECDVRVIPKSVYGYCYEPSSVSSQARFYVVNGSGIYANVAGAAGEPIIKRAIPFMRDDNGNWHFVYDVSKHEGNDWVASDTWYEPITTLDNKPVIDDTTGEILYSL